jgi:hypothetical protein
VRFALRSASRFASSALICRDEVRLWAAWMTFPNFSAVSIPISASSRRIDDCAGVIAFGRRLMDGIWAAIWYNMRH